MSNIQLENFSKKINISYCQQDIELLNQIGLDTFIYNQNFTLLHLASHLGHLKTVKLLLEIGGAINQLSFDNRLSALSIAAFSNQNEIVDLLLLHNADPNIPDNFNQIPLMYALIESNSYIAKKLIPLSNLNHTDIYHRKILDFAHPTDTHLIALIENEILQQNTKKTHRNKFKLL